MKVLTQIHVITAKFWLSCSISSRKVSIEEKINKCRRNLKFSSFALMWCKMTFKFFELGLIAVQITFSSFSSLALLRCKSLFQIFELGLFAVQNDFQNFRASPNFVANHFLKFSSVALLRPSCLALLP